VESVFINMNIGRAGGIDCRRDAAVVTGIG